MVYGKIEFFHFNIKPPTNFRMHGYLELVAGWLVQVALRDIRILGDFTCTVSALIKHVDYFRCAIRPRQAHFRMFSSRKANTSGSQMFTPRWRKSCPSSTVRPMGG